MRLEFDSISELEQFLMFSAHIGRAFATQPQHMPSDLSEAVKDDGEAKQTAVVKTVASTDVDEDIDDESLTQEESVTTKRKRRTKAEMEVARAAEALAVAAGNPFAQTSEVAQDTLSLEQSVAGTGLTATQVVQTAPRVIESIEHLRVCQSFIQQHGMAKYNESFRDGLNANIAAYTPEQRLQHVTILESLV